MNKLVLITISCILSLLLKSAHAGQIADLYQADVAAGNATEQWQQQALAQVLVRVSGDAGISSHPDIAPELKRASGYIKQFESVRHSDGNRMRVLLDAVKVNQLLQQHAIPVWGAMRPDILVWLVQQNGAERAFVRSAQQSLHTALSQAFRLSALPLLQPLYDMDDMVALSETDVWAGFWQQINQASSRYAADIVVAATIESINKDGETQLRLSWQRQAEGKTYRDEVIAADENRLMQEFSSVLAGQLAKQYASIASAGGNSSVVLQVHQLTDLADIVNVQRLLQQLVGVSEVTITQFAAESAQYQLRSSIGVEGLMNALRFNPQLQLQQKAAGTDMAQAALNATTVPVLATFDYIRR